MYDNLYIQYIRQSILNIGAGELLPWKKSVLADIKLFNLLFEFIFSNDQRLAWRSCWIIDTASEDNPDLLADKLPIIIAELCSTKNGSLKRHFTRILSRYEIPEEYLVNIVDRSFELLAPSEPIAVQVNAMQILYNITKQIPELKGELISVLESIIEEGCSAGFLNRSTKLLRKLKS